MLNTRAHTLTACPGLAKSPWLTSTGLVWPGLLVLPLFFRWGCCSTVLSGAYEITFRQVFTYFASSRNNCCHTTNIHNTHCPETGRTRITPTAVAINEFAWNFNKANKYFYLPFLSAAFLQLFIFSWCLYLDIFRRHFGLQLQAVCVGRKNKHQNGKLTTGNHGILTKIMVQIQNQHCSSHCYSLGH